MEILYFVIVFLEEIFNWILKIKNRTLRIVLFTVFFVFDSLVFFFFLWLIFAITFSILPWWLKVFLVPTIAGSIYFLLVPTVQAFLDMKNRA